MASEFEYRGPMEANATQRSAALEFRRAVFLIPPTGAFCREDRCQSWFSPELVPSMRPPLEECEAAGALRAVGCDAFVIDAPAEELGETQTLERVEALEPDLVVVVTSYGTLTDDLGWTKRIVDTIGAVVGVRGAPCYSHAEEILARASDVSFCVRGEYELLFAEIARSGFAGVPGVCHREGDRLVCPPRGPLAPDLDSLPTPDRSTIDPLRYRARWLGVPQASVRVQRGCPFPCSYCLVHSVSGNVARHRSPEHIAREIASLQRSGIHFFYLRAETFSLDRRWAIETSEAIARECPGAKWVTTTRVECVDDEVVGAMARGGCYGISFGIDAASRESARRVDKPFDVERAERAMRLCDAHGVLSLGYFVTGFLWESEATLDETTRFARRVRPDLVTIHFAHPYPGTRYHAEVEEAQARRLSSRAQAEPALTPDGLPLEALERHAARLRRRHYTDPRVLASLARKSLPLVRDIRRARKAL